MWAFVIGYFIINWEDRGVKNHIMHDAQCSIDNFIIYDISLCWLVYHIIIILMIIIVKGASFICNGINIVEIDEMLFVHDINLPEITAITVSRIIGLMIGSSSVSLICVLDT